MSTLLLCLLFFFSQLFFCLYLHKPINNTINILINRRSFSFLISFPFHKLFFILFFVNYVVFYLIFDFIVAYIFKPNVSSLKSFDIIFINLSSHIYDVKVDRSAGVLHLQYSLQAGRYDFFLAGSKFQYFLKTLNFRLRILRLNILLEAVNLFCWLDKSDYIIIVIKTHK